MMRNFEVPHRNFALNYVSLRRPQCFAAGAPSRGGSSRSNHALR
jgi:hypothetical protein